MSLQTIVQDAPIAENEKKNLLDRIAREGSTPEVVTAVREALQSYIDSGFKALGVEPDPNDPKVQAIADQLNADIDEIEAGFEEELENLNIDAAVAQAKANKTLDSVEAQALKAKMAV